MPALTIGIFRNPQPTHRLSIGSSRSEHRPLDTNEGWVLSKGSEGLCEYDAPLDVTMVAVDEQLIEEAGGSFANGFEPVVGSLDPVILSLCLNAPSFSSGGTLYEETMHRAIAAQLVQTIAPPKQWQVDLSDPRLARALDFIHDNLATDLTLADMAETAALSTTHFAKAFKRETGLSPLQYVIKARLELASVLLKTTALSVAEIAYRVGYNDLSRFG
ncbi:MAG: AraC family transcriptional regulator, partial [Pseudomonadota bacterium]